MASKAKDQSGGDSKPSAGLLRRALASSANAVEACPDPEILAAYADRALNPQETARYELHFSQCELCRDQLAAVSRAALPVAAARPPRLGWIWSWGWIALAPVTAVLLIAAVLIARRPAPVNRVAQDQEQGHPLVAQQMPSQSPDAAPTRSLEPPLAIPAPPPEARRQDIARPIVAPAPASPARSESDAMQGPRPDRFTADAKGATSPQAAAQALNDQENESARSSEAGLAMNERNAVALDKAPKSSLPAPPQSNSGVAPQNADTAAPRARTQTVIVESETSAAAPAAPPLGLAAGSVAGGNAAAPAAPPAKKESLYAARAGNSLAATQTVTVESKADRDISTLVRSPDPQVLWRVSSGRYVERSIDSGATWRAQWSSVNAHVVAGSAPSVDTCWLVGRAGIVLMTSNGKTWHTIDPPASADFVAVAASGASSATITADDGRRFETRDRGKHWTPAP